MVMTCQTCQTCHNFQRDIRFEDTLAVEDTLFVDRPLILLTVTWAYQVTLRMLRALDELFGLSLEGSTSQPEILEIFDPF